jgi:uncharacterized membrane protein
MVLHEKHYSHLIKPNKCFFRMKQINIKLQIQSSYMKQGHTSTCSAIYTALPILSTEHESVTITTIQHTLFLYKTKPQYYLSHFNVFTLKIGCNTNRSSTSCFKTFQMFKFNRAEKENKQESVKLISSTK